MAHPLGDESWCFLQRYGGEEAELLISYLLLLLVPRMHLLHENVDSEF